MSRFTLAFALGIAACLPTIGHAVSLSDVIRKCGDDGKALCKGVGYGEPMQKCLSANKAKLSPQCKPIIDRLDKGEKVGIFG